jgi:hypothetical protein
MESTREERIEFHREKMRNKRARRKKPQQTAITRWLRGGRIVPNNGKSNRIWPVGKVAKPGRMG